MNGMYVFLSLVSVGFPIDACDRVVEEAIYPSSFLRVETDLLSSIDDFFLQIRKSCPRNLQKDGRRQMTSKRSVSCSLCIILPPMCRHVLTFHTLLRKTEQTFPWILLLLSKNFSLPEKPCCDREEEK